MKTLTPAKPNKSASMSLGKRAADADGAVNNSSDLQSRYYDICLMDFEADVFSIVYHNPTKFASTAPQLSLSEKIRAEQVGLVHPDDAQRFVFF